MFLSTFEDTAISTSITMKNRFLSHLDASAPLSPVRMGMTVMASCSAIIKETDAREGKEKKE